ncbi:MAG TPA: hypothetical protein PLW72_05780 [Burkholderiaceae bacterium]|nr:hypothetical protein [Burkholderiaceae bacterium]HQR74940.1 hypothetical protein [Burkholderiaceae bacterium]
MKVTSRGAMPVAGDIAVGVAEIAVVGAPDAPGAPLAPGVAASPPPPPHAVSEIAANTTREPHKALATLALIPEVTSMFIVFLPVPLLTGSALCRRGRREKIGETDESQVPRRVRGSLEGGVPLSKAAFFSRTEEAPTHTFG